MTNAFGRRATYANVMATIAVFIALGGSGYAAAKINGKNIKNRSIAGAKLERSTLTGTEVKDGALRARDFKRNELPAGAPGRPGAPGPQGARGLQGAPGTALAFARVFADGSLDDSRSKNVNSTSKARFRGSPTEGYYCIDATVAVNNVVAAVNAGSQANAYAQGLVGGGLPALSVECPNGTDATVRTVNAAIGVEQDAGIYVLMN